MLRALAAAWPWFAASRSHLRRVSRFEKLDAADINRIVVAINRNQLLNARGALVACASALLTALGLGLDALTAGRGEGAGKGRVVGVA
jgi:hypothetical protein